MKNQRIVFTAPGVAELVDCPMPEVGANDVRVRVAISSISSGTERANVSGDPNISYVSTDQTVRFPRYGGYSTSGIVDAVGANVKSVKPGDRVAMSWTTHCRTVTVNENNVYLLPDSISFEAGALIHIATFPLAAIRKCRVEIGESAIVMGQGVLGLIAIQLLRAAGAVPIIAADPNPTCREKALKFGADYALDPFAPDFAATVKSLTRGGVKAAIEVTGNGKALDNVLDCMARFGRVALLGCTRHSDFTIDYYRKVHGPGITLIGAHTNARPQHESSNGWWTQRDDALALIALSERGRIDLGSMVEDTCRPEDAPEVYKRLTNSPSFPITQFNWS